MGSGVEVWPDNWHSVRAFENLCTQWRVAPGGLIGLDYAVMPFVFEMLGHSRSDWPSLFADIAAMEDAALAVLNEEIKR